VFALLGLTGLVPYIPTLIWGWLVILIQTIPSAITGILAMAIIADIARADGVRSGSHREAVFSAGNALIMKVAISTTNLVFPSLLLLGRSSDNDLGIRLTTVVGLLLCVAATVAMSRYSERRIQEDLAAEQLELL
ncbi:MAG: MFS transporter, partial [Spirochaetes bacterium]|nr:MFS transporter [Spirochaetota bacterium]